MGATVAAVRVRSTLGSVVEPLAGPSLTLGAVVARGPLMAEIRYGEGHLTSDSPAVETRDLVDGTLLVGLRAGRFLAVKVGPHARAYDAPSGTRRWVFWEARVQATAPLITNRLQAYAELGGTLLGSTTLAASFDAERSGEVGARWRLTGVPLTLSLAYRIDRGTGSEPTRTDTVEQVLIGVRAGGLF